MTLACRKCGLEKEATEFHKNSAAPGGLRLDCRACRHVKAAERYAANPDSDRERLAAWALANPEKARASKEKFHHKNKEKRNAESRAWIRRNKAKVAAYASARRARLINATPAWACKKYIDLFYELAKLETERTGQPVEVDHFYPLRSDWVCGLHVEHNLQLLFANDNLRKGNRMIETHTGNTL